MAYNKVIYANRTIMDLTGDTVTADTLVEGKIAHNAKGERIVGTMKAPTVTDDGNGGLVFSGVTVIVN